MSNNDLILNQWEKQISNYEKLTIDAAKNLYEKINLTTDPNLKKAYMDRLVLGTLYVVLQYIKRNQLSFFIKPPYDMNDVISSFNEVWINKIYNGELLHVSGFSQLFTSSFFSEVYNKLGGSKISNDLIKLTNDQLLDLFLKYVDLKNSDNADIYGTLRKYCFNNIAKSKVKELNNILFWFEQIYSILELDKEYTIKNNINERKVMFLKLIIDACYEKLTDNIEDDFNVENLVIDSINYPIIIKEINDILLPQKSKKILEQRFGLNGNEPLTFNQIAEKSNLSRARIRQITMGILFQMRKYAVHQWRNRGLNMDETKVMFNSIKKVTK